MNEQNPVFLGIKEGTVSVKQAEGEHIVITITQPIEDTVSVKQTEGEHIVITTTQPIKEDTVSVKQAEGEHIVLQPIKEDTVSVKQAEGEHIIFTLAFVLHFPHRSSCLCSAQYFFPRPGI